MDDKTARRRDFTINTAYFAALTALAALALNYLVPWTAPFLIGYAIAALFKPLALLLSKHAGLGRKISGISVLIFAYLIIAALIFFGGAGLIHAIRKMLSSLPAFYENTLRPAIVAVGALLEQGLGAAFPGMEGKNEALDLMLQNLQSWLLNISSSALGALGAMTLELPAVLLAFMFTVISSIIISINYQEISEFISRQIPWQRRELVFAVKNGAFSATRGYFVACLKIMGVTFLLLAAGLFALRVENFFVIAMGIALFDAFPVFGVGGIIIPWAAISLLNMRFPMALGLLVLYLIIEAVRGIVEPRIVGRQLGLHPLATLCAIYAGFKLVGVVGMIAAPIMLQILAGLHRSGAVKLWN